MIFFFYSKAWKYVYISFVFILCPTWYLFSRIILSVVDRGWYLRIHIFVTLHTLHLSLFEVWHWSIEKGVCCHTRCTAQACVWVETVLAALTLLPQDVLCPDIEKVRGGQLSDKHVHPSYCLPAQTWIQVHKHPQHNTTHRSLRQVWTTGIHHC